MPYTSGKACEKEEHNLLPWTHFGLMSSCKDMSQHTKSPVTPMFADLHYWLWSKSEAPGDSGLGLNNTANFSLFHPHPLLVRRNITQETFLKALSLQLSLYWSGQKPSFRALASLLSGRKRYHTKMEMAHQMSPLHWGAE